MKLAIISHTEHYCNSEGAIVGWGPTVTEINHLAEDFEEIVHVAFLHKGNPPASSLPYTASNIKFVPIKPVGGKGMRAKAGIVFRAPRIINTIRTVLRQVDVFQFRAPTGMGVFVVPYLTLFSKKKGWYKYAGNWKQDHPPLGYALQRWMLTKQRRTVTINGYWPDQPKHCLSFENPCLTEQERLEGLEILKDKNFSPPFTFCFVGRLGDAKGVQRIIDALGEMDKSLIGKMHFIGNGQRRKEYGEQCFQLGIPAVFHGFLPRGEVFEIYRRAHFFLLPSTASEGFPKVIAESMNYGCVPVVSNVSSIGHYINTQNGFVYPLDYGKKFSAMLQKAVTTDSYFLRQKSHIAHQSVEKFTFEHYRARIFSDILRSGSIGEN